MKGMQQLLNTIERIRAKLNPRLHVAGILPTIYKARTLHSQEVLQMVKQHFGDKVFDFPIKDSIRFAESPLAATSILQYAAGSDGADAYRKLAQAVMVDHKPGQAEASGLK
jgi:chromosome partitioning protein